MLCFQFTRLSFQQKLSRRSTELASIRGSITLHHSHSELLSLRIGAASSIINCFASHGAEKVWFLSRWNYKLTITDAAKDGLEFMCLDRGEVLGFYVSGTIGSGSRGISAPHRSPLRSQCPFNDLLASLLDKLYPPYYVSLGPLAPSSKMRKTLVSRLYTIANDGSTDKLWIIISVESLFSPPTRLSWTSRTRQSSFRSRGYSQPSQRSIQIVNTIKAKQRANKSSLRSDKFDRKPSSLDSVRAESSCCVLPP